MGKAVSKKDIEKDARLCEWVNTKFKQSYVAKAPLMEDWKKYDKAYSGELFNNVSKPDYKSNQITNHIFSTIESIRPIMTDNDPQFLAEPTTPDGMAVGGDIQVALNYEWHREKMATKLPSQLIPMLVYGTCVWFLSWDGTKGDTGEINCKPVNPFNIFPDPLAEDIEGAEYIIYATYKHANQLKKSFPDKAEFFVGSNISMSELVAERDRDAVGQQEQVLTLEMWYRDWTSMEEIEDDNGNKKSVQKFPNGRVITCCPDIGIVLSDKENPYKDGKFPFVIMKDYEKPFEFWGHGEVEQILSPQLYMNELSNQIIDNAKSTGNMPWIIDRNCGITPGKLTNRPGLVIRKNPGTEVRRETPPAMPNYIRESIEVMKKDISDVSGVFDSLKGERQTGVVAAQAIMALQEASQARVRLKIKIMEDHLSELASMWYSRMQQFWKFDRWVKVTDIENNVDFREITPEILKNNFDIKIGAGSTMPTNKNAMLDLMIRLAQTTAEDGKPMVTRKTILNFLPNVDKQTVIKEFEQIKAEEQQLAQQQQEQQMQAQQEQQAVQQQMEQAKQLGEEDKKGITDTLTQISSVIKTMNTQIDELMNDKENNIQEEKENEMKNKEYERGIKDGVKNGMQEENEEEKEIVDNSEEEMPEEDLVKLLEAIGSGEMPLEGEEEEMMDEEGMQDPGQMPIELLQQIASMSDEELSQLLQERPEILEMLQGEKQMMGNQMIGGAMDNGENTHM